MSGENKNIYRDSVFTGIILLLMSLPIVILGIVDLMNGNFFRVFRDMYSCLVVLCLILFIPVILNIHIKRYILLLIPFYALIPVVVFTIILFEKTPTRWMFVAIIEANQEEIKEFLEGMFFWKLLFIGYPAFIVFLSSRLRIKRLNANLRIKKFFLLNCAALIVISYSYKALHYGTLQIGFKKVFRTIFKDTPVYSGLRFTKAIKIAKIQSGNKNPKVPYVNAISNNPSSLKEIYVLVIGESSRYANWGINGYKRATSPNLDSIINMVTYSDMISPSGLTKISLPLMLTTNTITNYPSKKDFPSVISIFREAGFFTWWITNQSYSGKNVAYISSQSNKKISINCKSKNCYDGNILNHFNKALIHPSQKKLLIIHLKGSHYPYHNRYPVAFDKFKPSLNKNSHAAFTNSAKEKVLNSYDNSIYYTDYILHSIINSINIDSVQCGLMYVSDHGDCLFDSGNKGFGRHMGYHTKSVYHVPFFVWVNSQYIQNNSNSYHNILNNSGSPYSSEFLIHSISEFAGIDWNGFQIEKSILSNTFENMQRYIIYNNRRLDYDEYFMKEP